MGNPFNAAWAATLAALSSWAMFFSPGCLVAGAAAMSGCAYSEPVTRFGGGPFGWEFVDTKDNDIEIVGLNVDPASKVISAEKIVVRNNASDVIVQNVQQMLAFVEQQRAANEGIAVTLAGLSNMMGQIVPLADQLRQAVAALPAVAIDLPGIGSAHIGNEPPANLIDANAVDVTPD